MKKRLLLFLLSLLLAGCATRQAAQAQFIGFTSPQTTQDQPFDDVGVGTFTTNVPNRGQNTHIFNYRLVSGTTTSIIATIEASNDGTNFFTISDTARALTEGITTASGYFPLVRCRIVITGTSPVVDGFYSGTSISLERPRGLSDASAIGTSVIATAQSATIILTTTFNPPGRKAGGQYIFNYTTVGTGGVECYVQLTPHSAAQGFVAPLSEFVFYVAQEAARAQRFLIPNLPADQVQAQYGCGTFPSSGSYDFYHIAGDTDPPRGNYIQLQPLTAAGTTDAFPAAAPVYSAISGEDSFSISYAPRVHTVQLNVTGAPATCTFQLEGSMDVANLTGGTFFDLSGAQTCTSNILFHVTDRPVTWVRGNLTALTGGTSPTVTMRYLSTAP